MLFAKAIMKALIKSVQTCLSFWTQSVHDLDDI